MKLNQLIALRKRSRLQVPLSFPVAMAIAKANKELNRRFALPTR